jgi:hypothetical protein
MVCEPDTLTAFGSAVASIPNLTSVPERVMGQDCVEAGESQF